MTCSCGYRPRREDVHFIEEHQVIHVICYGCGKEWIE